MGLYNFQRRFEPLILSGQKQQTFRGERKYPDIPGDTMHLYVDLRQPTARLLGRPPCIERIPGRILSPEIVFLDGVMVGWNDLQDFARLDGFDDWPEMFNFFESRLPFVGDVYRWDWSKRL